jgi:repressor LexA
LGNKRSVWDIVLGLQAAAKPGKMIMNFSDLSDRQQRIVHFIVQFTMKHRYPPSIRQIGDEVEISSTSVVKYNLGKLEDYKLISRDPDVSRGLSINYPRLYEIGYADDHNGGSALAEFDRAALAAAISPAGLADASIGAEPEYDEPDTQPEIASAPQRFRVPLLGKIAAGEPIAVNPSDVNNPEDWVDPTEFMASVAGGPLFALRVQGDSMTDASVLDGDIVILRHQETANNGEMVAVWIEGDDETTLKRFYREGPNVRLMPASPNPIHQPIIRPADKVSIKGKVVSVFRVLR